jgi:hypothetical protein
MPGDTFASIGVGEGSPDTLSSGRRRRGIVRCVERACCDCLTYFPLVFVYGLTTWAVWVETSAGFAAKPNESWIGTFSRLEAETWRALEMGTDIRK